MASILRSVKTQNIPINPAVVISNVPDARGLVIAKEFGASTEVIDSAQFLKDDASRMHYDTTVMEMLQRYGVTPANGLVCLAGFMRILSSEFVNTYRNRILNIHPSLLPSFPGLHSQRQAIQYGAKISGCTVHFVDAGMDTGPIIIQSPVQIMNDDTEESLSDRILHEEHVIYPRAVDMFARGIIKVSGRQVTLIE